MSKISLPRQIAFDIYTAVMDKGQNPEEQMEIHYQKHAGKLDRRDRNFIKEVVFGTLRWHGKIYWILQNTSNRNLDQVSGEIRAALLCGAYQIYYMEKVPDRAAVNESAEYVRLKGQAAAVSFVNGILRQIARKAAYFTKPDKEKAPAEYLSVQFAYPKWITTRWLEQFRFPLTEKMLLANNQPPPYTIRINVLKTALEKSNELQTLLLRDEHTASQRRPLRSALHLEHAADTSNDSLFGRGFFTIQDEASQLIGYMVSPKEGDKIADVCAGPGGKLSHLYELAGGNLDLTAIERGQAQFDKIRNTMERLGHNNYKAVLTDFLEWFPDEKFTKILLDAPCSGMGVLRRHPEGKWLKQQEQVKEKAKLQRKMVEHALTLLKPGGELIFSVCSHEPEETLDHLKWLRQMKTPELEVISPLERLPDYYKRYVTKELALLIYSGNPDEMDGFGSFIVRLKDS